MADAPERHRFEARLGEDGVLAALVSYERSETWVALLHTEVQEGFEGQGVGSRLVHWICDEARRGGFAIIPRCAFVVRWLERHPEQHDILSHPLPPTESDPPDVPPSLA
jgi:hypothetical protein